ncbi:ABC transporter ATP-binding protein [Leucobacter sp. UT-8R-CII-1-4]|uniref:ABC transporter ATP-binding protein n=1 Tax=Leucobacter sp. UT-8R-CII-1-4 TaxID=3040075 RepID=UPI0024A9605D|nr:ABC transporter ATP-binding protein [Leucobacter sp. UT-8R-CII-1-4]MDI6022174.1 ABC transporter ATP-binding protein [Leucobacter sp. UT-8R-CII-1-4]
MATPLLNVRELGVEFHAEDRPLIAVDSVSFSLARGEALAIVGESGSGKSVSSLALMGLLPKNGVQLGGSATFDGIELLGNDAGSQRIRGDRIAMIYQDAMTALNPTLTIGRQFRLVLRAHGERNRQTIEARTVHMLERVGISNPSERLSSYPHQFSGGQLQRIMIALALVGDPELLIADEPTTALDVTVQAQIVDLVMGLRKELNMAVIWITHDLSVIARLVDRIAVMYAGRLVEEGPVREVLLRPAHHYTAGLIASLPRIDRPSMRLEPIPGGLPTVTVSEPLCQFADRCPMASRRCREALPPIVSIGPAHQTACVHPLRGLVSSESVAQEPS